MQQLIAQLSSRNMQAAAMIYSTAYVFFSGLCHLFGWFSVINPFGYGPLALLGYVVHLVSFASALVLLFTVIVPMTQNYATGPKLAYWAIVIVMLAGILDSSRALNTLIVSIALSAPFGAAISGVLLLAVALFALLTVVLPRIRTP